MPTAFAKIPQTRPVGNCDDFRTKYGGLFGKKINGLMRRKGKYTELIREVLDHAQRIPADRASRADKGKTFHSLNNL